MKTSKSKNQPSSLALDRLYEGILDSLISLLQTGGRSWSQYTDVDTSVTPDIDKNFDPKENLESQMTAAVCVLQHVGYAINSFRESLNYLEEQLVLISEDSDNEEFFAERVSSFFEYFDQFLIGTPAGWLQDRQLNRCSQRVYDIGQEITSTDAVEVLGQMSSVFSQIKSLDIPDQAAKVFATLGAEEILDETNLKVYYDETVPMFDALDSLIERIETFSENVKAMIDLTKEKSQSSEIAADQEPAPGTVFELNLSSLSDVLFD